MKRLSAAVLPILAGGLLMNAAAVAEENHDPLAWLTPTEHLHPHAMPEPMEQAEIDLDSLDLKAAFTQLGHDGALWYQHVQTFSNPWFEGRVNGSEGTERSREYMIWWFEKYNLQPAFPTDTSGGEWVSYRQPFEFTTGRQMRVTIEHAHAHLGGDHLIEGEDFTILGNSSTGHVEGPVTFVGYGIEDGPDGYSSFEDDADLSGRIALLLRYEPLDAEGRSQWANERFSAQAGIARKIRSLTDRNAAGIILVNPPGAADGRTGLEPIGRSMRFGRDAGVPIMQLTPEAAQRLVQKGTDDSTFLLSWRKKADSGEVKTVPLNNNVILNFGGDVSWKQSGDSIPAENIGAVLPGRGSLASEYVVIGGHYDHNGYGWFGTNPDDGELFPGADDNASGVAGILVLAKKITEQYRQAPADADLRSVLFIAFDAEERGLYGSAHYKDHTTIDPSKQMIMLNMDMMGRLGDQGLEVGGVETAVGLHDLLRPHLNASGLDISTTPAGSGRSDDANFAAMSVPAMHFFTGMHPEYTTPQDHAWTVNPFGAARIVELMFNIAMDMATRNEMLVYQDARNAGGRREGRQAYAGVRLGIRPGLSGGGEGVKVDQVSPNTSASEGGMKDGDIIVGWNDADITTTREMLEKLREHEPGDTVKITVMRNGEQVELDVTLKASDG